MQFSVRSEGSASKFNFLFSVFSFFLQDVANFDENALTFEWRRVPLQMPESEKERLSFLKVEDLWVEMKGMKNGGGEMMYPNFV